jgi:hypothetical protein
MSSANTSAAGVGDGFSEVSQSGLGGFFGGKEKMNTYTATTYDDPNYDKNKAITDGMANRVNKRGSSFMAGTQVGPAAQINTDPNSVIDQQRTRQNAFLNQMAQSAAGNGPSAAQAQLKTGADRAMASNLAMAAAGGTPASMRQAAFNNAAAQQDLAGQSGALRAQEQQAAQGLYGSAINASRDQELGLATTNAGLQQQTTLAQAGMNQDTAKTNLAAGIDQQNQKDDLVKQYLMAGMSLDQANMQATIQQRQFNAGLLTQQEAAGRGVSAQNAAQGAQLVGSMFSAASTSGASLAGDLARAKK